MTKYIIEPEHEDDAVYFDLRDADGKMLALIDTYDYDYSALSEEDEEWLKDNDYEADHFGLDLDDLLCLIWVENRESIEAEAKEWLAENDFEDGTIGFYPWSQEEAEARAAKWLEAKARIEKFAAEARAEDAEPKPDLPCAVPTGMTEEQVRVIVATCIARIKAEFWCSLYLRVYDHNKYNVERDWDLGLSYQLKMAKKLFGNEAVNSIAVTIRESEQRRKLIKRMNSNLYRYDLEYYLTREPEVRERKAAKELLEKLKSGCPTEYLF